MTRKGYKQTEDHVSKRITKRLETLANKPKPVSREWLDEHYTAKRLDCVQIGAMLGYDPKTIWSWLRYYGIPTRPRGGTTAPQSFRKGDKNAFEGHSHTDATKEKIRAARLADGHVPYLKDGEHWLRTDGVIHPNWKGGITPERQAFYLSDEWRKACKIVWARADAKCERCGKRHNGTPNRGTFAIHHIVSFAVVELRAEPSNLALLCKQCHLFVHSRRNVNREFLKER